MTQRKQLPDWNNENARKKVLEVYKLPEDERIGEADRIQKDFTGWALANFELTDRQQICLKKLPQAYTQEVGYLTAHAVRQKYDLTIWVTDDSTPAEERKKKHSVKAGWNEKDGFYTEYEITF